MLAAQAHLLECDDCRRQLSWIQGDLVSYAMTAEMQEVPAGAKERLMRSIAKEKKVVPITAVASSVASAASVPAETTETRETAKVFSFEDAPVRRKMGFGGWAGWAVAAAAIGAAGLQYQQYRTIDNELATQQGDYARSLAELAKYRLAIDTVTDSGAKQVVLHLPQSKVPVMPEGRASYLPKKGSVVFFANNLGQLQANTTYELWLIPAGPNAKPIPAGTFKPNNDGVASVVTTGLPTDVQVGAFGVTIEPEGGSASPTLPIVLAGE
jgi:hypothetical protein